ncbi:hypothetical protein MRX96_040636 [Rhipicephalus microplus]
MERCFKSSSYRDDFTKYAPCLNKVGSKFHTCVKNFIMDLDVASRLEPRQRITGGCCKYKKLEVCMSDAIRGTCDKGGARLRQETPEALRGQYAGHLVREPLGQGEVRGDQAIDA